MARKLGGSLVAGLLLLQLPTWAADSETSKPVATASPSASPTPASPVPLERRKNGGNRDEKPSPEMEGVLKAVEALSPEQKRRFQENFLRWTNLSPEEKKALQDRNEARRKWIREELDAALADSGLQLEGERREQFLKRYGDERRKLEEQLRKELAEKRKPLVKDIIARLRAEFSASATPMPSAMSSPAPVSSPASATP